MPSYRKDFVGTIDNPGQNKTLLWIKAVALPYTGDDCLIWPFSKTKDGYGGVGHNGRWCRTHRVICEVVNGPPPTPSHEAAHSCGRGHEGCVNPRHLSWKTRSENQIDRNKHGTFSARRNKLTPEQVIRIRASDRKPAMIAREFGMNESTIRQVRSGKLWKHLPLTPDGSVRKPP